MDRVYLHRYKMLTGELAGQVFEGVDVSAQAYPDQWKVEGKASCDEYGVWLNEPGVRVVRTDYRDVEITDEGVRYGKNFMDTCVPFDRFNKEIFVGDTLYISSKNEVVPCVVEKISKTPFMGSYGIMNRKLTVRPVGGGSALTINDPRSTVKAPKI